MTNYPPLSNKEKVRIFSEVRDMFLNLAANTLERYRWINNKYIISDITEKLVNIRQRLQNLRYLEEELAPQFKVYLDGGTLELFVQQYYFPLSYKYVFSDDKIDVFLTDSANYLMLQEHNGLFEILSIERIPEKIINKILKYSEAGNA